MRWVRAACVLSSLVAATWAVPAKAQCGQCAAFSRFGSVVNEQRGLPLNFLPRVAYFKPSSEIQVPTDVVLQEEDSAQSVPGAWEAQESGWWQFRPTEELKPLTRYVMLDRFGACDVNVDCERGDWMIWLRFTTGTQRLTRAPGIRGPVNPICVRRTCELGAEDCCGPYDGYVVAFQPGLTEPLVRLTATVEGPALPPTTFEINNELELDELQPVCTSKQPTREAPDQPLRVRLTAHDLAGNQTASPHVLLVQSDGQSCEVTLESEAREEPVGCHCRTGPGAALPILLLALASMRRGHSRARRITPPTAG